jgi:hypothetical protein
MANEAYDRLERCIRTREVGIRTREVGIRTIRVAQVTDQKAVPLACPIR